MVTKIAVTQAIATLRDAHERFNLTQVTDEQFFPEWRSELPELTPAAIAELEHLKQRYLYLFLKLMQGDRPAYALSHNFTLLSDANNNLQRVAQVLRHLVAQF